MKHRRQPEFSSHPAHMPAQRGQLDVIGVTRLGHGGLTEDERAGDTLRGSDLSQSARPDRGHLVWAFVPMDDRGRDAIRLEGA